MKLRHVRAVAVAAVVVVALTGARRGGSGGGCDDHDSSSSSSSSGGSYTSGGSSDYDNDDDYEVSTGGSSTGTPTGGPTTPAEQDVRITDCVIDSLSSTEGKITWKYTVTNGDSTGSASYSGTLVFKDSAGAMVGSAMLDADDVAAGQSYDGTVDDSVFHSDMASLQGRCEVNTVTKIPSL
ncbi:hypothetical protein ACFQVC_18810 [Streptomyces monticola]|uniref:DUF4352 domain-containing protein n=1 Tax=Streptomyces monticola TaxID=2666263 RepID=A0ABW2JL67_9ACTN